MKVLGAAFLIAIAAPAAADRRLPAQQPAGVQTTCELVEVWASHGKGQTDAAISKQLTTRLNQTLKQNEFKHLSTTSKTLDKKKPDTVKLKKGSVTVTFVEIVDKSQVRLKVDFNAAKGTTSVTPLVAAGDWTVVSQNQSSDPKTDAHVIAVSCK